MDDDSWSHEKMLLIWPVYTDEVHRILVIYQSLGYYNFSICDLDRNISIYKVDILPR